MELKQRVRFLYNSAFEKYNSIVAQLDKIMLESNERIEGNCFHIDGRPRELARTFKTKRYNLFNEALTCANIMEIGFNGGHSCLIFLLANPYSRIQIFDLGDHNYAYKCYELLNLLFPDRLSIVWGNSLETVGEFKTDLKYDLIHIDGGHGVHELISDINNAKQLSSPCTKLIIDDISYHPYHATRELTAVVVDKIVNGEFIEMLPLFQCPYHVFVRYNFSYNLDPGRKCEHDFVEQE